MSLCLLIMNPDSSCQLVLLENKNTGLVLDGSLELQLWETRLIASFFPFLFKEKIKTDLPRDYFLADLISIEMAIRILSSCYLSLHNYIQIVLGNALLLSPKMATELKDNPLF